MTEKEIKHSIKRIKEITAMDTPTKSATDESLLHIFNLVEDSLINLKIIADATKEQK